MRRAFGIVGAAGLCVTLCLCGVPPSARSGTNPTTPATTAMAATSSTTAFTTYTRIYGQTADATAKAELEHQFPAATGDCPRSRAVVLATDATYPDALSSAYLAGYLGTGTLLTPRATLSKPALTAIHVEGITKVYVVGGPLAIDTSVLAQLRSTPADVCGGGAALPGPQDVKVTRIFGQTEYDTAEKIAETPPASNVGALSFVGAYDATNTYGGDGLYNDTAGLGSGAPAGATPIPTAVVATGAGFQDAEGASTLAYAEHLPVLLTAPTSLSSEVSQAISTLKIRQVILMGGQLAVSNAVVWSLEGRGVSVLRVAGQTYSATSVELADFETATASGGYGLGWHGTGSITVARGDWFSDGLAGAVVAADGPTAAAPAPLVLTLDPTTVGTALTRFLVTESLTGLGGVDVSRLTILGGPLAITQTTINVMGDHLYTSYYFSAMAAQPTGGGYWLADTYGADHPYGTAQTWGALITTQPNVPSIVVGIAATHDGKGYWMVERDGVVAHFGDAATLGYPPRVWAPIVAIVATPPSEGTGYWLVTADGFVYAFGAAHQFGTLSRQQLATDVVGMAATPDGQGYRLVTSGGNVVTFGDATFHGSNAGKSLPAPIMGIASSATGGYWEVDEDGNVTSFTAPNYGSATKAPAYSVGAIAATPTGRGYWLVGYTGVVYPFGAAKTYALDTVPG